ncbi:MAG TPA: hypothetical protein VHO50_14475 [Bacteroidales bacterium]|nr:hypothetical protein [Bacteroidales bacterium]
MKTVNFKILVFFLVLSGLFNSVMAQEKAKSDQERKEELLRAIEDQKKVLNEGNKALMEKQKEQAQAEKELAEKLKEAKVEFNDEVNVDAIYRSNVNHGTRPPKYPDRFFQGNSSNIPNMPNPQMSPFFFGEDVQRTTWEFSKSVKDNTFKREYEVDVEKTTRSVNLTLNGDCKSGEVKIKVVAPGGKTYSDVTIDQYGSMNVRKSLTISETENQDKTGEWKFIIESANATGYFKINFQTF